MLPWWVASLIANLAIICTEYINRHATAGWASVLPQTVPLIVVAQFCLFRSFNGASHWLWAWVFFAVGNSFMRMGAVYLFGAQEVASWFHILMGATAVLTGAFLIKEGLA